MSSVGFDETLYTEAQQPDFVSDLASGEEHFNWSASLLIKDCWTEASNEGRGIVHQFPFSIIRLLL